MMDLSEEQRQIVGSPAFRLIVQAQPGSGKTRVLVERLLIYLKQWAFHPDQIVVITFTEKAVSEIKERISQRFSQSLEPLWISTIHGFCHRILSEHPWEADFSSHFSVLSAEEAFFLKDKAARETIHKLTLERDASILFLLREYGYSKFVEMIFTFFDHRYDVEQLRRKPVDSSPHAIHVLTVFDRLLSEYQSAKRSQSVCDFDDLLWFCHSLLETYPDICESYRRRFKAILIDEFQDTDPLQTEIMKCLTKGSPAPSLMVVGDPKQSIYRFRGADLRLFEKAKKDIIEQHGFYFEMIKNYRSHPHLIDFVNHLFEPMMTPHFLRSESGMELSSVSSVEYWKLQSGDKKPGVPWIMEEARKKEARWLASYLKELQGKKFKEGSSFAILFRAMTYSHIYEKALDQEGVPWVKTDSGFFYQSFEVEAHLGLLKWALMPQDVFSLWSWLLTPWSGLSEKMCWALGVCHAKHSSFSLDQVMQGVEDIEFISVQEKKKIKEIYMGLRRLQWMRERVSLVEWYHIFWDRPLWKLPEKVQKFLKIVREFECQHPDSPWKDFLVYMETLKASSLKATEPQENLQEGVRILSVHQAKGLEFDAVFVPDLSYIPKIDHGYLLIDKELGIGLKVPDQKPSQWKEDVIFQKIKVQEQSAQLEESKRLFYVALTRARYYLILSHGALHLRKNSWALWIETYKTHVGRTMKEKYFV